MENAPVPRKWYEKYYLAGLIFTTLLFAIQIVHLFWLFGDVIMPRLFVLDLFPDIGLWNLAIILVDYTEIPALITTSLFYIFELKKSFSKKSVLMLILLNSQWLHLFWISDEFVISAIREGGLVEFPIWLAYFAIFIDYLEVPVIIDLFKKTAIAIREKRYGSIPTILKK